jgi:ubiquinone/menaquinone biosynthesis C-methylase UbiE
MQPMGLRFSDDALPVAYDRLFTASLFEPWARILIDLVGVRPGDAVLDVATGPGTVARMVAARAGTSGRVVGVDISEPMLEVARSKPAEPGAAPIEFIRRSADDLQLPDASFDVVLCQQGLQFFPDQIAALREMRRALNPRGRLGISVWAKGYGRDIEELLSECLTELGARQPTYPNFGTHADDLTAALSEVGFVPIRGEDRTLEIRLSGGVQELLESWGAGPMRAELMALDSAHAQQFCDCVSREVLLRFSRDGALVTPSVARLAIASAPTQD